MNGYQGPVLLDEQHDIANFDCGDEALNDWLKRRSLRNQRERSNRTWVATIDSRVVAFYASSTAVLTRSEATKKAARNQPEPLPAMLLARLAVDQQHQRKGLGAALLKHFLFKVLEVADHTGVRIALVHAKDESAANFYRLHGFEPSPIDQLVLMLLTREISAQLTAE